jgi:hypothetical protein
MADASQGVIEGGTWEHRKRAQEMLGTADSALALTVSNGTLVVDIVSLSLQRVCCSVNTSASSSIAVCAAAVTAVSNLCCVKRHCCSEQKSARLLSVLSR